MFRKIISKNTPEFRPKLCHFRPEMRKKYKKIPAVIFDRD